MDAEAEGSGNTAEEREPQSARRDVVIVNPIGLHARPAADFVHFAGQFRSEIFLIKAGERFSAASILEVLMADLTEGSRATLEATGPDADMAVEVLAELIRSFQE